MFVSVRVNQVLSHVLHLDLLFASIIEDLGADHKIYHDNQINLRT